MAARSLYHHLLKAGVKIYKYQPQILHAKLILADVKTYVGSSNFDIRSLNLNYELMLRFTDKTAIAEAQEMEACAANPGARILGGRRTILVLSLGAPHRDETRWEQSRVTPHREIQPG